MPEKSYTQQKEQPLNEMAQNAMRNYQQALQTSLKLQEEAARWWTNLWSQSASPQDWQKRFTNLTVMMGAAMPAAQRRMEEIMGLMEQNSRSGAELFRKAMDAAQSPVPAESQAKWMEFWTAALKAAQTNTETLTQIGARAMNSWMDFIQKNTEVTSIRVPKTA